MRGATTVDAHVGREIRRLRQRIGMSQTALGEALGVTFQQIQKYERGTNRVSASALWEICQALQCQPSDLFPPVEDGEAVTRDPAYSEPGVDDLVIGYAALGRKQRRAVLQMIDAMQAAER